MWTLLYPLKCFFKQVQQNRARYEQLSASAGWREGKEQSKPLSFYHAGLHDFFTTISVVRPLVFDYSVSSSFTSVTFAQCEYEQVCEEEPVAHLPILVLCGEWPRLYSIVLSPHALWSLLLNTSSLEQPHQRQTPAGGYLPRLLHRSLSSTSHKEQMSIVSWTGALLQLCPPRLV